MIAVTDALGVHVGMNARPAEHCAHGGHAMGAVLLTGQKKPAGQGIDEFAFGVGQYAPAGQSEHALAPGGENVPAGHAEHGAVQRSSTTEPLRPANPRAAVPSPAPTYATSGCAVAPRLALTKLDPPPPPAPNVVPAQAPPHEYPCAPPPPPK